MASALALTSCSDLFGRPNRGESDPKNDSIPAVTIPAPTVVFENDSAEQTNPVEKPQQLHTTYAEYFLNGMSDAERTVYEEISSGLFNCDSVIDITDGVVPGESFNDFLSFVTATSVLAANMDSNYQMYVDDNGFVTKIEPSYSQTAQESWKAYNDMLQKAQEITILLDEDMSDYEKVKYLHDYIIKNCVYDGGGINANNAYGCLCEGKGVCESYSKAFSLLCELAGVPSVTVLGSAVEENGLVQSHMWNKVMVDGIWYNVDCTWDDPTGTVFDDYLRYDYFLLCDADMSATHTEDYNAYMTAPAAWDANGTYFLREGLTLDYYTDAAYEFSEQARKFFDGELPDDTIRFRCYDEQVYQWAYDTLFTENYYTGEKGINDILGDYLGDGQQIQYYLAENRRLNIFSVRLVLI